MDHHNPIISLSLMDRTMARGAIDRFHRTSLRNHRQALGMGSPISSLIIRLSRRQAEGDIRLIRPKDSPRSTMLSPGRSTRRRQT